MRFLKVIPLILVGFLVWTIARDLKPVLSYWTEIKPALFLLSVLFLLIDYPQAAVAWHVLLKKMGVDSNLVRSSRIWIISTTARYLPGSVWQYLGRVEMGQKEGIPRGKTIASLLIETFLALVAGVFMAVLALPFIEVSQLGASLWVFLLPLSLVLFHPKVSAIAINIIAKVSKEDITKLKVSFKFTDAITIFPWYATNFLINGLALFFLVGSLGVNIEAWQVIAFTGFYALSWVLGFVAIFAPAGIGVTEASLTYLLSFSMPLSLAATVSLSYRFFLTIAELAVFLLVLRIEK